LCVFVCVCVRVCVIARVVHRCDVWAYVCVVARLVHRCDVNNVPVHMHVSIQSWSE